MIYIVIGCEYVWLLVREHLVMDWEYFRLIGCVQTAIDREYFWLLAREHLVMDWEYFWIIGRAHIVMAQEYSPLFSCAPMVISRK